MSVLKNLLAGISIPPTFSASAFDAVPINLGRNPPTNCSISELICGSAMFMPDRIVGNPDMIVFGVKLSLLNTITGISAI